MFKIMLSLFLVSFLSLKGNSQNSPKPDTGFANKGRFSNYFKDAEVVLVAPFHKAEFDSAQERWHAYLHERIDPAVPLLNKAPSGTYQVIIQFAIDKEGNLKNFRAESNCGYGLENEVIRCIKTSPKWKPATTKSGERIGSVRRQVVVVVVKSNVVKVFIQ